MSSSGTTQLSSIARSLSRRLRMSAVSNISPNSTGTLRTISYQRKGRSKMESDGLYCSTHIQKRLRCHRQWDRVLDETRHVMQAFLSDSFRFFVVRISVVNTLTLPTMFSAHQKQRLCRSRVAEPELPPEVRRGRLAGLHALPCKLLTAEECSRGVVVIVNLQLLSIVLRVEVTPIRVETVLKETVLKGLRLVKCAFGTQPWAFLVGAAVRSL